MVITLGKQDEDSNAHANGRFNASATTDLPEFHALPMQINANSNTETNSRRPICTPTEATKNTIYYQ